jgi:hypothetical protein
MKASVKGFQRAIPVSGIGGRHRRHTGKPPHIYRNMALDA